MRPLARFAWLTLAYNIAVMLWGAYVRATGSLQEILQKEQQDVRMQLCYSDALPEISGSEPPSSPFQTTWPLNQSSTDRSAGRQN
jgi:hypothetical protein